MSRNKDFINNFMISTAQSKSYNKYTKNTGILTNNSSIPEISQDNLINEISNLECPNIIGHLKMVKATIIDQVNKKIENHKICGYLNETVEKNIDVICDLYSQSLSKFERRKKEICNTIISSKNTKIQSHNMRNDEIVNPELNNLNHDIQTQYTEGLKAISSLKNNSDLILDQILKAKNILSKFIDSTFKSPKLANQVRNSLYNSINKPKEIQNKNLDYIGSALENLNKIQENRNIIQGSLRNLEQQMEITHNKTTEFFLKLGFKVKALDSDRERIVSQTPTPFISDLNNLILNDKGRNRNKDSQIANEAISRYISYAEGHNPSKTQGFKQYASYNQIRSNATENKNKSPEKIFSSLNKQSFEYSEEMNSKARKFMESSPEKSKTIEIDEVSKKERENLRKENAKSTIQFQEGLFKKLNPNIIKPDVRKLISNEKSDYSRLKLGFVENSSSDKNKMNSVSIETNRNTLNSTIILSNLVLKFINEMKTLQESISKKSPNIKDLKINFENMKYELKCQAEKFINLISKNDLQIDNNNLQPEIDASTNIKLPESKGGNRNVDNQFLKSNSEVKFVNLNIQKKFLNNDEQKNELNLEKDKQSHSSQKHYEELNKIKIELEKEKDDLNQTILNLNEKLIKKEQIIFSLNENMGNLIKEKNDLTEKLSELNSKYSIKFDEMNKLLEKASLNKKNDENVYDITFNEIKRKLESENKELKEKIENFNNENKKMNQNFNELNTYVSTLLISESEKRNEMNGLKTTIEEKNQLLKEIETNLQKYKVQIEHIQNNLNQEFGNYFKIQIIDDPQLKEFSLNIKKEILNLKNENNGKIGENLCLKADLISLENKKNEIQKKLTLFYSELSRLISQDSGQNDFYSNDFDKFSVYLVQKFNDLNTELKSVNNLRSDFEKLSKINSENEKNLEKLKLKISELEIDKNSNLDHKLSKLNDEIKNYKNQIDKLLIKESELTISKDNLEKLKIENEEKIHDLNQQTIKIKKNYDEKIQELENKLTETENSNKKLREDQLNYISIINNLEISIQSKENNFDKFRAENEEKYREFEKKINDINNGKKKFEMLNYDFEIISYQKSESIEEFKSKLNKAKNECDDYQIQIVSLKEEISQFNLEINKLQERNIVLNKEILVLKTEINEKKTINEKLNQQVNEYLESEKLKTQMQNQILNDNNNQYLIKLEKINSEYENRIKSIENLKNEELIANKKLHEEKLFELGKKFNETKNDLENLIKLNSQKENEKISDNSRINQELIDEYNNKLSLLTKTIEEKDSHLLKSENEIKELNEILSKIQIDNQSLLNRNQALESSHNNMKEILTDLNGLLFKKDQEIENMKNLYEDLKKSNMSKKSIENSCINNVNSSFHDSPKQSKIENEKSNNINIAEYESKIEYLTNELNQKEIDYKIMVENFTEDLEHCKSKLFTKEIELNEYRSKILKYTNNNSPKKESKKPESNEKLKEEINLLEEELEDLEEELESKKNAYNILEIEFTKINKKNEELTNENEKLKKESTDLNTNNEEMKKKIEENASEYNKFKIENKILKFENKNIEKLVANFYNDQLEKMKKLFPNETFKTKKIKKSLKIEDHNESDSMFRIQIDEIRQFFNFIEAKITKNEEDRIKLLNQEDKKLYSEIEENINNNKFDINDQLKILNEIRELINHPDQSHRTEKIEIVFQTLIISLTTISNKNSCNINLLEKIRKLYPLDVQSENIFYDPKKYKVYCTQLAYNIKWVLLIKDKEGNPISKNDMVWVTENSIKIDAYEYTNQKTFEKELEINDLKSVNLEILNKLSLKEEEIQQYKQEINKLSKGDQLIPFDRYEKILLKLNEEQSQHQSLFKSYETLKKENDIMKQIVLEYNENMKNPEPSFDEDENKINDYSINSFQNVNKFITVASPSFRANDEPIRKLDMIKLRWGYDENSKDYFNRSHDLEREFNEKLRAKTDELTDMKKQRDNYKTLFEKSINSKDDRKNDFKALMRSGIEKVMGELTFTPKSKELFIVILKMLDYNDEDINDLFTKKEPKKKGLFGIFGKK